MHIHVVLLLNINSEFVLNLAINNDLWLSGIAINYDK